MLHFILCEDIRQELQNKTAEKCFDLFQMSTGCGKNAEKENLKLIET